MYFFSLFIMFVIKQFMFENGQRLHKGMMNKINQFPIPSDYEVITSYNKRQLNNSAANDNCLTTA